MALILNLNPGANNLQPSPTVNGLYAQCGVGMISGTLTTDTPAGETINSITIDEATITINNLVFDGVPITFPYTVSFGTPVSVDFEIILTGTVGNTDNFKFTFNLAPFGAQSFTYVVTELDIQDSITIANNTLPLDFGSIDVGSFSDVSFVVNNETCIRYGYEISTDGEITFAGSASASVSPFPRTTATLTARWQPTTAYDLSAYKIFCDMDCGQAMYDLAGISNDPPPPPVGGKSYKKLIIANSISI